jgi:hypothetical protein
MFHEASGLDLLQQKKCIFQAIHQKDMISPKPFSSSDVLSTFFDFCLSLMNFLVYGDL